jgi:selenocysteine-specific elongation factor
VATSVRERLASQALLALDDYHRDHSLEPGAPLQWLRSRVAAPDLVATALLAALHDEGLVVAEQGLVRRRGFAARLTTGQSALSERMLACLSEAGSEPPTVDELAAALGAPAPEVQALARLLAREGALVAVESGRYYRTSDVAALLSRLQAGMLGEADYSPGDIRDFLGLTRKFLIPFLEYCDREGYTIRNELGRRRLGT